MERFLQAKPHLLQVLSDLGKEDAQGYPWADVVLLRREFAKTFSMQEKGNLEEEGYWPELFQTLLSHAQDPETAVPEWLRVGVPLGIDNPIELCGVFPPTDSDSAAIEASKGKCTTVTPHLWTHTAITNHSTKSSGMPKLILIESLKRDSQREFGALGTWLNDSLP